MDAGLDLIGRGDLSGSDSDCHLKGAAGTFFGAIIFLEPDQRRRNIVKRKVGVLLVPDPLESSLRESQIIQCGLVLADHIERQRNVHARHGEIVLVVTLQQNLDCAFESCSGFFNRAHSIAHGAQTKICQPEPIRPRTLGINLDRPFEAARRFLPSFPEQGQFSPPAHKLGQPPAGAGFEAIRERVREALGPDIDIMIDVNMGWDAATAIEMGRKFEQYDIYWLEEPVPADDFAGYQRIAAALDMRVVGGETHFTRYDLRPFFLNPCLPILQPDPMRGGMTDLRKIAVLADTWGITIAPHLFPELNVHLLASIPNGIWCENMGLLDDVWIDPPEIKDGMITAPERPGHGLRFKEEVFKFKI